MFKHQARSQFSDFHTAVENTCSEYHTWKLWRGKTLVNVLNQSEGKILANDLHV